MASRIYKHQFYPHVMNLIICLYKNHNVRILSDSFQLGPPVIMTLACVSNVIIKICRELLAGTKVGFRGTHFGQHSFKNTQHILLPSSSLLTKVKVAEFIKFPGCLQLMGILEILNGILFILLEKKNIQIIFFDKGTRHMLSTYGTWWI